MQSGESLGQSYIRHEDFLRPFVLLLITKKYQNLGKSSIKSFFFARRPNKASAEGRSPPQELEEGPRSGPYLLVLLSGGFAAGMVCYHRGYPV